MPRYKINYAEGDWFAVPLDSGGYGIGLAARIDKTGGILGYFFGTRIIDPRQFKDLPHFAPSDAIDISIFGDLGLLENRWRNLGGAPNWDRAEWPIPKFGRVDAVNPTRAGIVEYDEILNEVREARVDSDKVRDLPEDGLAGYRAVELMLDHLISHNLTLWELRE